MIPRNELFKIIVQQYYKSEFKPKRTAKFCVQFEVLV